MCVSERENNRGENMAGISEAPHVVDGRCSKVNRNNVTESVWDLFFLDKIH